MYKYSYSYVLYLNTSSCTKLHVHVACVSIPCSFEKVKTLFVPLAYSATLHPSRKWVVTGGDDLKLYKFDYEEEREVGE